MSDAEKIRNENKSIDKFLKPYNHHLHRINFHQNFEKVRLYNSSKLNSSTVPLIKSKMNMNKSQYLFDNVTLYYNV